MTARTIIPKPGSMVPSSGVFELKPTTRIKASRDAQNVGKYLEEFLRPATGYSLTLEDASDSNLEPDQIVLTTMGAKTSLGDEGYELKVTPEAIIIRAPKPAGLFYGIQTLRQLFPPDVESPQKVQGAAWTVPATSIEDRPRFKWRGMHLDVGRHMFPVEFIKRYIDLVALHKMNVLHWHLTEDQGWRIEIKQYPKLTEIGSKRAATPTPANRRKSDGKPYGGFYTQEQIKQVVAYAADRFVTVVPEIEMPGHSIAALASYPELGCTGGPYAVRAQWGLSLIHI